MEKNFKISTLVAGAQLVEHTIVTALEGGSNYWYWIKCDEHWFEVAKRYDKAIAQNEDPIREHHNPLSIRISNALLNVEGFEMNVYDLDNCNERLGVLTFEGFKKGCELCQQNFPDIWGNILREDHDAGDADVLFQLAVMGELKFS